MLISSLDLYGQLRSLYEADQKIRKEYKLYLDKYQDWRMSSKEWLKNHPEFTEHDIFGDKDRLDQARTIIKENIDNIIKDKQLTNMAWLLVQHMDNDIAFQKWFINYLKEESEEYKYLTDRISVNQNKPQKYNTQQVSANYKKANKMLKISLRDNKPNIEKILGILKKNIPIESVYKEMAAEIMTGDGQNILKSSKDLTNEETNNIIKDINNLKLASTTPIDFPIKKILDNTDYIRKTLENFKKGMVSDKPIQNQFLHTPKQIQSLVETFLKNPGSIPPVIVSDQGKRISGAHRIIAAALAMEQGGPKTIKAWVMTGW